MVQEEKQVRNAETAVISGGSPGNPSRENRMIKKTIKILFSYLKFIFIYDILFQRREKECGMRKCDKGKTCSRYLVPAFARGLRLIELLSEHPEGLLMTEMDPLGLPQASLFRMLTTLCETGYAAREKNGLYRLNGKLLSVAYKAVENRSLIGAAEGPMRELRDRTGESVMLAVLHGSEGVVVHQTPSDQPVKVILEIGHRFPLHSAAPAKAILAFLPDNQCDELIRQIRFTRFTPHTIRNERDFRKELELVRRTGIAFDRGEEMEDLRCAAAPVRCIRDGSVAAVWITGPASRMTDARLRKFAAAVKKTAKRIETGLNGRSKGGSLI